MVLRVSNHFKAQHLIKVAYMGARLLSDSVAKGWTVFMDPCFVAKYNNQLEIDIVWWKPSYIGQTWAI